MNIKMLKRNIQLVLPRDANFTLNPLDNGLNGVMLTVDYLPMKSYNALLDNCSAVGLGMTEKYESEDNNILVFEKI